jgi:hypothetical protein
VCHVNRTQCGTKHSAQHSAQHSTAHSTALSSARAKHSSQHSTQHTAAGPHLRRWAVCPQATALPGAPGRSSGWRRLPAQHEPALALTSKPAQHPRHRLAVQAVGGTRLSRRCTRGQGSGAPVGKSGKKSELAWIWDRVSVQRQLPHTHQPMRCRPCRCSPPLTSRQKVLPSPKHAPKLRTGRPYRAHTAAHHSSRAATCAVSAAPSS